ncbi:MAG: HPP family protein [Desulfovibrionaceae bacterium]
MKVREVMIPVGDYVSVGQDETLLGAFQALERRREANGAAHAHRDVLVLDAGGAVAGKLTMADILLALEPTYGQITSQAAGHDTLTREYVARMFKEFDLWPDTLDNLCRGAAGLKVGDICHRPGPGEFVEADDDLERAIHRYLLGVHQPLLVRQDGRVVGVLRYSDVFEQLRRHVLGCAI